MTLEVPEAVVRSCRSCGAPVWWLENKRTQLLAPINPEQSWNGNVIVHMESRTYELCTPKRDFKRHTSHIATCPDARKWRKGR